MAQSYSSEWKVSEEYEEQTSFDRKYGMYLWQWTFYIHSGSDIIIAKTQDFAQTERKSVPPRCYPGEAKKGTYNQECHKGFTIPNA